MAFEKHHHLRSILDVGDVPVDKKTPDVFCCGLLLVVGGGRVNVIHKHQPNIYIYTRQIDNKIPRLNTHDMERNQE